MEEEDDPEEFDDWVDNLYGFAHLINPSPPATESVKYLYILASQLATPRPPDTADPDTPIEYYKVPRSAVAVQADK